MSRERIKTRYPGVFYRVRSRASGPGNEKVYSVTYRKKGKLIEQTVGRQYKDNMTPAKASTIRANLMEGREIPKAEKRAKEKQKIWTFTSLWTEYKGQRVPSRSLSTDDGRFRLHVEPQLGNKEPGKLVPLDIDRLRINLSKTKSPQTVKHVISLVKRIAAFGQNKGLCPGLNFRPQTPLVDNRITENLSPEQLRTLLAELEITPCRTVANIMKLALFTGMRRGEILKLRWADIDFHRGFIEIVNPKGGRSQSIPMNKNAEAVLKAILKEKEFVFPARTGGHRVDIAKDLRTIKNAAGLPASFRPMHGLRHVFASNLASSGKVDLYVLQRLLTHKSPVMTQRYAHLRDATLKAASDIAGEVFNNASNITTSEIFKKSLGTKK